MKPKEFEPGQIVRGQESGREFTLLRRAQRGVQDGWEVHDPKDPKNENWISDWQMTFFKPVP